MGFNNRRGHIKSGMKVHSWINSPNKAHRVCTKCGMRVDVIYENGNQRTIYTTKNGLRSETFIGCE